MGNHHPGRHHPDRHHSGRHHSGRQRVASASPLSLALPLLIAAALAPLPARAQQEGYGQTINSPQQQRELDYGTGPQRNTSVLDATNPIDLMNRLRRATAMDDATPPSDAIDAALRDFQAQPAKPSASPGSSQIRTP